MSHRSLPDAGPRARASRMDIAALPICAPVAFAVRDAGANDDRGARAR
ncbi:hypothetical protein [Montanilutibacter psychrotolerans]|nr:hypothetical protein [Lysobacter psychrotolerans]